MIIAISGKKQTGKDTVGKIIQYHTSTEYQEKYGLEKESFDEFLNYYFVGVNTFVWKIRKFSEKLKEIISILTGIPVSEMEKEEVKNKVLPETFWVYKLYVYKKGYNLYPYISNKGRFPDDTLIKPTLRDYLKYIGTDLFRDQLHPDIWINSLMNDYNDNENWIITDLRFKNEFNTVKEKGGVTIKVVKDNVDNDSHKSENDLDDVEFDYTIDNNGSIEELIEKVREILIKEKIL